MWRWSKKTLHPDHDATSVIDQGCQFEGRLTFVGTLIVNGKFQGELISSSTLVVGETGELEADVHAGTIILAGRVSGNIETDSLVISKGGVFNGQVVKMHRGSEVIPERRNVSPALFAQK